MISKNREVVIMLEGCHLGGLYTLGKWAARNFPEFRKCKALYMGRSNLHGGTGKRPTSWKAAPQLRTHGSWWTCSAQARSASLQQIKATKYWSTAQTASQGKWFFSLCLALLRQHMEYCISARAPCASRTQTHQSKYSRWPPWWSRAWST